MKELQQDILKLSFYLLLLMHHIASCVQMQHLVIMMCSLSINWSFLSI